MKIAYSTLFEKIKSSALITKKLMFQVGDALQFVFKDGYCKLSEDDIDSPVMIDRLHFYAFIGLHEPIADTVLIESTNDGELVSVSNKSIKLSSEYNQKEILISIRSVSDNTAIEVITSPNKFLFGHNLYGSSDMQFLVKKTLSKVLFDIQRSDLYVRCRKAPIELHSVDINSMMTVGLSLRDSQSEAGEQAVEAGEALTSGLGKQAANKTSQIQKYILSLYARLDVSQDLTLYSNTLQIGNKDKSDYAFRVYDKYVERNAKKMLEHLSTERINYLEDKVRVELILNKRELFKNNLMNPYSWEAGTAFTIFEAYREKLKIMKHKSEDLSLLEDDKAAGYYCRWKYVGDPVELIIENANTRTKYRKLIKEKLGMDIYRPYSEQSSYNPLTQMVAPSDLPMNGIPETEEVVQFVKLYKAIEAMDNGSCNVSASPILSETIDEESTLLV